MLASGMAPTAVLAEMVDDLAQRTSGVFGVNILMPYLSKEWVDLAAEKCHIVDFFYGDPDPELVGSVKRGGAIAGWQCGSVEEAKAAVDAGCDFVAVQGAEAGGRLRGHIGLLPLLTEVLDEADVPVVAAGGITTPRAMAAVLAAGASAVRIGTRFIATRESGAHPVWIEALLSARGEDAMSTDAFSVLWPPGPQPHRVLRSCIEAAENFPDEVVGETSVGRDRVPMPRHGMPPPGKQTTGAIEAMALYAGQGVGAITEVSPAMDVVRELAEESERLLRGWREQRH
jgi:NAD(P)H-dependent flavin oxidoreductase YrpB (nitropropane dioxygenase family)